MEGSLFLPLEMLKVVSGGGDVLCGESRNKGCCQPHLGTLGSVVP